MMKNTISNSTDSYIFSEDEWSADEEWVAESRRRARKKKELERQRRLYAHLLAATAVLFAAIVLVLVWGAVHGAFRSGGKQSAGVSVSGTGNPDDGNGLIDSDGTESQTSKHSVPKPNIDESDKLDAIIYNGERYCGLGMKWVLEELPDDFELIGQFFGALTDDNEELSSTMIFHDNDDIYHYVDEEGKHYFCVACSEDDMYIGIYEATVSWNYEIDEPHEITY